MNNLPTVPVHDILIHPRENDLIIGTHGLGIWICDNITALQQLTPDIAASEGYLFENRRVTQWRNISRGGSRGHKFFSGQNPPRGAQIYYYLGENTANAVLEISDVSGNKMRSFELTGNPGINRYIWNLRFNPPQLTAEEEQYVDQIKNAVERQDRRNARNNLAESLDKRGAEYSMINRNTGRVIGPIAKPGIYKLTFMAAGQTMHGILEIRQDPIFENK